jgi:hypothetical protein
MRRQSGAMPSQDLDDWMDLGEDETMNLDGDIIPGCYLLHIGIDGIAPSSF